MFIYVSSIEIQVLDNKRGTGFSPEELVYFDQSFFVVDSIAARIYSIDLQDKTKQQSRGYYGEGVGRFISPTGSDWRSVSLWLLKEVMVQEGLLDRGW